MNTKVKLIRYNYFLLFSGCINIIYFLELGKKYFVKFYNRNFQLETKDIIPAIGIILLFLLISHVLIRLIRRRYALKITEDCIEFNLIGIAFNGKINKSEILDTVYNPKKKSIELYIRDEKLFIKRIKNPIVRLFIKRKVHNKKPPITIKSELTNENITEIKLVLDYLGYSKKESKLSIL